ncbi:MAG TPA: NADH-quinone oxidoreductase subunit K, partial [candidate division Zixibacteria bacterium]|nr:NADH-quinone oxidoreductase subunit K [candidate division Zixibacteria bacterium]
MFYFLSLSSVLFAVGMYGVLARKNLPGKVAALFIMLQAVLVNLAAFNKFVPGEDPTGIIFIFFILPVFVCQVFCLGYFFY